MTRPTSSAGTRRWWIWLPLLAVAAGLAFFADNTPVSSAVSLPTRAPARVAAVPSTPASAPARALREEPDTLAGLVPREQLIPPSGAAAAPRDPFSTRSWNAPLPMPAASAAPAAPVAPPLPYAFIGKKQEGDDWEVYLTRGESTFVVREGEVLEGSYRVDRVAPPTLSLTYLPLGQVQTLPIGETR